MAWVQRQEEDQSCSNPSLDWAQPALRDTSLDCEGSAENIGTSVNTDQIGQARVYHVQFSKENLPLNKQTIEFSTKCIYFCFQLIWERNLVKSKCVQQLSSKVRSNNAKDKGKKYSWGKKQLTCSCQITIKRDKSILHTITLCYISDWFCYHFPSLCVVTGNGYYYFYLELQLLFQSKVALKLGIRTVIVSLDLGFNALGIQNQLIYSFVFGVDSSNQSSKVPLKLKLK